MRKKTFLKFVRGFNSNVRMTATAALVFASAMAFAQDGVKISGKVVDDQGYPLPGVNVIVAGTTQGTITDMDGNYTLSAPEGAQLQFSFIGFDNQSVAVVAGQSVYNVTLEDQATDLNEVVVMGYGVQKKKLVTGATVQVSGENLQKLSTTSALTAMQSQTPGVNIVQSNGQPGEGFKVNIRGLGTVGNSSPLYVIDGVTGGDINNLNPSDIESIDVLKDAASAAIYGARAANGVILVTTKQGKSGKMTVSYDGYIGVQNVYRKPDLLNAQEYMTIQNEVAFNENRSIDWKSTLGQRTWDMLENGWTGTNWFDEITNEDASIQNHAFNIAGGNETSKVSIGFSYAQQDGILGSPVESKYERYTARLNSEHVLYKIDDLEVLKFGENLTFYNSKKNGLGQGNQYWNDVRNVLVACPLMPVYNEDGELYSQDDKTAEGWNLQGSLGNPIIDMIANRGMNESRNYGLNVTAFGELQPIKGLKFRSAFSYRQSSYNYRALTSPYNASVTSKNENYSVQQQSGMGHSYMIENTLSYHFNVAQNAFDVLVGQSYEDNGIGFNQSTKGTVKEGSQLPTLKDWNTAWLSNMGSAASYDVSGSPYDEGALASYFGRVNWNFQEKYMATFTMRADGSSNFAKGNRWGYFPSVSAGWVMSSESFMSATSSVLDFFKIRGSWGQNGNCAINNFQYVATVAFDKANMYNFGSTQLQSSGALSTGGYTNILPNPDVTWETSEQIDLGFDARLLGSRLAVNFDWYKKTTKDWLIRADGLSTAGTNMPFVNGGDVENTGIEFMLAWNDNIGDDFTYGVTVNFAKNKNEVTRIANAEGIIHGNANVLSQGTDEMFRAEEGQPIGYFWGYKTEGVMQNAADVQAYLNANCKGDKLNSIQGEKIQPGDLKFVDNNGDGKIDPTDKTFIGDPNPDCTLGASINLGYKGFDFSVTGTGAFGHQIAKSYRRFADSPYENYTTDIFKRWTGAGTSNELPRLTDGSNPNWQNISDIYIQDADFFKIQNITIGYDFKKLWESSPFQQLRLYFTIQNVATFTGYDGMDPEIGYGSTDAEGADAGWCKGIDLGTYPMPRTVMGGVNIKF